MNCHSSYALKNTCITGDTIPIAEECPSQYLNFIFIPNIDSINLSQFDAFYSKTDTEHKYPIYRKIVGGNYGDNLDLGKAQITFFKIDEDLYNVGVIDRQRLKDDPQTMYVDKNRYGAINPGTKHANTKYYQYSFDNDAPLTQYAPFELFGITELQQRINGKITGLPAIKDIGEGTDRWIIPIAGNDFKFGNNFTTYKGTWNIFAENDYSFLDTMQAGAINNTVLSTKNPDTEAWAVSYNFGYQRGPAYISIPSNSPGYPSVYPMPIKYADYSDINSASTSFLLRDNTNFVSTRAQPLCYGFIKDDNDEYYILTVSRDKGNDVCIFLLYKLSTIPTTSDLVLSTDQNNSSVITQDATFANRVNEVFPKLFFAAPISDYSGDAPDAVGPGDPYTDLDNTQGSVGGDTNTEDVIDNVNTGANDSFNVIAQNGFFGSYYLTTQNLQSYVDTLSLLFEHSTDLVWGIGAQAIASRIENGTTGLIALPYTIPADSLTDPKTFVVGNAGIKLSGASWNRYITEKVYEYAKIIKDYTYEWPEISLGTIPHYYDNFLDFEPYSSASIFLPFLGKQTLPINLIQSTSTDQKELFLSYRFNHTNGDFVCILKTTIDGTKVPICHWSGNCARNIQLSIADDSPFIRAGFNQIASMFSIAANIGGGGSIMSSNVSSSGHSIGAGASSGMDGSVRMGQNSGMSLARWVGQADFETFANRTVEPGGYAPQSHGSSGKSSKTTTSSTSKDISGKINLVPSIPPGVNSSSHMVGNMAVSGELGWLDIQKIIIYVERPIWWKPYDYGNMMGYPTKKTVKLRSVKGFAKIPVSHIKCSMTSSEKEELAMMLAGGVIFDESDTV